MTATEEAYRAALRWYPRAWREVNGDAILGTLLDVAAASQRESPTSAERLDLALSGLRARLDAVLPEAVRDRSAAIALGIGTGLALWLVFAQWWTPFGFGPYPKPDHVVVQPLVFYGLWILAGAASLARFTLASRIATALTLPAGWYATTVAADDFLYRPATLTVLLFSSLAVIALLGRPTRLRSLRRHLAIAIGVAVVGAPAWYALPTYFTFSGWLAFPRDTVLQLVLDPAGTVAALFAVAVALAARRRLLAAGILIAGLPWYGGTIARDISIATWTLDGPWRLAVAVGVCLALTMLVIVVARVLARPTKARAVATE